MACHDGGLSDLIVLLKDAYMKWECAVLCDHNGSNCCPILWSKTQCNIVLDKACKKDIDARMDPKGEPTKGEPTKGEAIACTSGRKRRKCVTLYYYVNTSLK